MTATNTVGTGPPSNLSNQVTMSGRPAVSAAVAAVAGTTVTLHGTVNPQGAATSYYFQYGSVPPGPRWSSFRGGNGSVGSGVTPVPVTSTVSIAGGRYYFMLVATNAHGAAVGGGQFAS